MRITNGTTFLAVSVLLLAMLSTAAVGKIIYVDDDATGANDGSNWVDAYPCIQNALANAVYGDEVRVAKGIYQPDKQLVMGGRKPHIVASGDRTATFQLINGVTLKGRYAGFDEPDPNARDVGVYETILSGDLNGDDVEVADPCDLPYEPSRAENSLRVVIAGGTNATAVLDGFTITGGNANSTSYAGGGGMVTGADGSPTVINCTFTQNSGDGGGAIFSSASSSTISNCTFSRNSSSYGGGIWNLSGSLTLINCAFTGNYAHLGGGMLNSLDSGSTLVNCTFSENSAETGGGMRNEQSNVELTNCKFSDNTADYNGGGMYNSNSSPVLSNCILEGNSANYGGGMSNHNSSPTLLQCMFTKNLAGVGNAMSHYKGSPVVINCTFSGNVAEYGCEIYCRDGSPVLTNCILWGDTPDKIGIDRGTVAITYSNVQGGYPGEGNIDTDPLFADPNNGDYHLKSQAGRFEPNTQTWVKDDVTSPCIDAGNPMSPIGYEQFPNGAIVNMGAYGGTAEASLSPRPNKCFPADHPDYDEWVQVGEPVCWCYERQCRGDADCKAQGKRKYWVSTNDLDILIAAWNKPFAEIEGRTLYGLDLVCADFDHRAQGRENCRVSTNDLDILIANWNVADKPHADCP
jgi:hypothetical protein